MTGGGCCRGVPVVSRGQPAEVCFFLPPVRIPGLQLRPSSLEAGTLTLQAVSPALAFLSVWVSNEKRNEHLQPLELPVSVFVTLDLNVVSLQMPAPCRCQRSLRLRKHMFTRSSPLVADGRKWKTRSHSQVREPGCLPGLHVDHREGCLLGQ